MASIDTVFNCVIPYIQNGDDRNSVSLVCRKWYKIDCLTRKQVTVHEPYAPTPSRLFKRFPFIESLTLKGQKSSNRVDVTRWIREISVKFKCLKSLRIRFFVIRDSDLELLAEKRGKDLRSLKLYECGGFTENGLMCVAKYCSELKELCLDELQLVVGDEVEERGKWLRVLALRKTAIEKFSFYNRYNAVNTPFGQEDVAFLVEKCRESLVSLRVRICGIDAVGAAIRDAVKLQEFFGAFFNKDDEYNGFTFPLTIHRLGLSDLPQGLVPFDISLLNQLRELELRSKNMREDCQCFFLQRCPNLEVLHMEDGCADTGLRLISQFCKKLRKLTVRSGTHVGLIAVAQGCPNLEYLDALLTDISNEALECIGSSLKNLRVFCTFVAQNEDKSDLPLDNGIRAMLMGCTKLERLSIHCVDASHVTDVGLGFIGKYGVNLRFLSLTAIGESDEGLSELSKGCPKLRKLEMKYCPFSDEAVINFGFNIHSLRYIWVDSGKDIPLGLTRLNLDWTAQLLAQLKPYVRLAQRLDRLAEEFVAGGTGLKSVKVTCSSIRELGYNNTQLLRSMVAKGIRLSEEQVILYESSKKQAIEVQIADVESRFKGAISESGDIKVEGTLKNGVSHLTKVGALEVDVSLEGNINMVISRVLEQCFVRLW
ncbi:hypothetical protein CTI12_AA218830 [Artemisia annua]|uniref:COI1 F-box domain-containing protein n=1 Tax=Artemisia annua TaxID=35608 RepID=A0A2U1NX33_ARTAN|nr:hypothetical protein CTI12_AA218830 [Artemisia annua]